MDVPARRIKASLGVTYIHLTHLKLKSVNFGVPARRIKASLGVTYTNLTPLEFMVWCGSSLLYSQWSNQALNTGRGYSKVEEGTSPTTTWILCFFTKNRQVFLGITALFFSTAFVHLKCTCYRVVLLPPCALYIDLIANHKYITTQIINPNHFEKLFNTYLESYDRQTNKERVSDNG